MTPTPRAALGREGEEIAREYLQKHGFAILTVNFRFLRAEVDIIAREGETLVFCEVKTRLSDRFGQAEEAVTKRKQEQIRRAAEGYLLLRRIRGRECRFDVVAIRKERNRFDVRHIRNAF